VEVKIGVLHTPREIVVESTQSPDEVEGARLGSAEERRRPAGPHGRARPPRHRAGEPDRLHRNRAGRHTPGGLRRRLTHLCPAKTRKTAASAAHAGKLAGQSELGHPLVVPLGDPSINPATDDRSARPLQSATA